MRRRSLKRVRFSPTGSKLVMSDALTFISSFRKKYGLRTVRELQLAMDQAQQFDFARYDQLGALQVSDTWIPPDPLTDDEDPTASRSDGKRMLAPSQSRSGAGRAAAAAALAGTEKLWAEKLLAADAELNQRVRDSMQH